jgi:sugar-specific transcriptional regulator TrmB
MSLELDSLDLNSQESKVYLLLLALGPLSLGEIIKNAEFTLDESNKAIEGLKNKDYVHEIPGLANRFSAIIPWTDLKASTETTLSQMESLAGQLDDHIAQKLSIILGKLRDESEKVSNGIKEAQSGINQVEMKAEGDIEAKIAKFTLEAEQESDQTKTNISNIFESKSNEHQTLVSNTKESYVQKTNEIFTSAQAMNQKLLESYQSGLDSLQEKENERNTTLTTKVDDLVKQSTDSFTQGIQNVHGTMEKTGQKLYESIDERNEKIKGHITNVTGNLADIVAKVSNDSQLKVTDSIGSVNEKIQEQLATNKQVATAGFVTTSEDIKTKSVNSAQDLQQTINETLVKAQSELTGMLEQAQESLSQTISNTRNQVESTINEFSESVKLQTDGDFQKIVSNTESTLGGLAQEAQVTFDKSKEEVTSILSGMKAETNQKTNEIQETALVELDHVINTLKTDVNSQLEDFKTILEPQQRFLNEKIAGFQSEFSSSQTHAINTFTSLMKEFKSSISAKNQELSELINKEKDNITESVNRFIEEINDQLQSYDIKFSEVLTESADRSSEKVIAKTREFQEKIVAVVNEMGKAANDQLTVTSELISSSIKAEMGILETELQDYASKFKEYTLANEEVFKNHLYSLEKLASLVTETKHPEVETASIVSKEATLTYIRSMFSRMKGGITLLIPDINDIPVDLILSSKNHQRISIVTIIDLNSQKDFIKKLFQKPNVRVRSVDQTKFIGVEGYLAADRDGEEVLIGVAEDKGGIVAIASESDAFINLMGKIVLGDYFLARSQEINRIDVGM